jgi:hypothetical protein
MRLLLATLFLAAPLAAQPQKAPMTKASELPAPPRAEQRPYSYERHGYKVEDPYFWLKDQGYPKVDDEDVLAYLNAENAYFEAAMKPHSALVETIFQEMKGRIKEDESSVPYRTATGSTGGHSSRERNIGPGIAGLSRAAPSRCCSTRRRKPRARNITGSATSR